MICVYLNPGSGADKCKSMTLASREEVCQENIHGMEGEKMDLL